MSVNGMSSEENFASMETVRMGEGLLKTQAEFTITAFDEFREYLWVHLERAILEFQMLLSKVLLKFFGSKYSVLKDTCVFFSRIGTPKVTAVNG